MRKIENIVLYTVTIFVAFALICNIIIAIKGEITEGLFAYIFIACLLAIAHIYKYKNEHGR